MYYKTISSPLGQITLMGTETKLTDLHIEGDRYFSEPSNDSAFSGSCQSLERAANQLSEYVAGTQKKELLLMLETREIT